MCDKKHSVRCWFSLIQYVYVVCMLVKSKSLNAHILYIIVAQEHHFGQIMK